MDRPREDPSTRAEVDLMILDYLLCIAISSLLQTTETEGVAWSLDTIDTFLLIFQEDIEFIPDDLRTKLQIFDFLQNFLQYAWPTAQGLSSAGARSSAGHCHVLPKRGGVFDRGTPPALLEIVTQFILLSMHPHTQTHRERQRQIMARLIMQAALGEIPVSERRASESFDRELLKAVDELITALARQLDIDMAKYWSPPMGITLAAKVETSSREVPLQNLQGAIVDFLSNLTEGLDAPVLVQLERGQLEGLTRAETKQLKERVGLR